MRRSATLLMLTGMLIVFPPASMADNQAMRDAWFSANSIARAAEVKALKCEAALLTQAAANCAELFEYVKPGGRLERIPPLLRSISDEWVSRNVSPGESADLQRRIRYVRSIVEAYAETSGVHPENR